MLDEIFKTLLSIVDVTWTVAGTENKSILFKVIGYAVWLFVLAGIIGMFLQLGSGHTKQLTLQIKWPKIVSKIAFKLLYPRTVFTERALGV